MTLLAAVCAASPFGAGAEGTGRVAMDVESRPEVSRQFLSPGGRYELTVLSTDHWKTPRGIAELVEITGKGRRLAWRKELPHHHGPRRVLVTDTGTAILIDEWINSPSPYSLTVIDVTGNTLAQYSIEQIISILQVDRRTISTNAKIGIWLSRMPILSSDGKTLGLHAGGRGLELELATGRLSIAN